MSLNVLGSINQSNSEGLHGWCPWVVSVGGLHRFLMQMILLVVVGSINQSKSEPMMSLNVVGEH